jgi:hypothetical protein
MMVVFPRTQDLSKRGLGKTVKRQSGKTANPENRDLPSCLFAMSCFFDSRLSKKQKNLLNLINQYKTASELCNLRFYYAVNHNSQPL